MILDEGLRTTFHSVQQLFFLLPAKRHHFSGRFSGPHFLPKAALRPGVVFASLASTDAPQCIASADVLHRLASLSYRKTSPTLA